MFLDGRRTRETLGGIYITTKSGESLRYLYDDNDFEPINRAVQGMITRYIKRYAVGYIVHDGAKYYLDSTLCNPVCFNCDNCLSVHKLGCCSGSPFYLSDGYISMISEKLSDILAPAIAGKRSKELMEWVKRFGFVKCYDDVDDADFFVDDHLKTFRIKDEYCLFAQNIKNMTKCLIHKYALAKSIDVCSIKPTCCMLFPLDGIEFTNGNVFLFGLCDKTSSFSRWGDFYLNDYLCINKNSNGDNILKNRDMSLFSDYIPLYKAQKYLVESFFDSSFYTKIDNYFSSEEN